MNFGDLHPLIRRWIPRSWRNSLRNPAKTFSRAWRKLRFRIGQVSEVQMQDGWQVHCHPLCIEAFAQFRVDPHQQAELKSFAAHCLPGMQLLDLGAHWGFLTLAALHYGGQEARSVAVEPSEPAERLLKTNLKLNACLDRTTVLNKAVGQAPGTLDMLTTGAGGNDYFVVPTESRADVRAVPQTTIDEICGGSSYQPTHVKIDVEGYEQEVLLGGKTFLPANLPTVFLELHGDLIKARGRQPEEPLRLLESYGYHCFEQDGRPVTVPMIAKQGYVARLVCLAR